LQTKLPTVHILASILAWASSVINPFIYAVSNRQYMQAYKALLCPRPSVAGQINNHRSGNSSRSDSRKTFITEMLHINTQNEKVKISKISNGNQPR